MIFLSYSRENSKDAIALQAELNSNDYDLLTDRPLVEGEPFWRQKIKKAWNDCELMIVLWSVYALQSPWVDQEVRSFAGVTVFVTLDQTVVPAYYDGVKVNQREVLSCLKQLNLLQKKIQNNQDTSVYDIASKRALKIQEWQSKLNELNYLKKNRNIPIRISEVEWTGVNGIILRPILQANQQLKRGETVKLLSVTPVTNAQFLYFTLQSNWPMPSTWMNEEFKTGTLPVVGVSWFDAIAYANWFGASLPTIAEWERAASSGNENKMYATNDNSLSFKNSFFLQLFGKSHPADPAKYPSNATGFYGMSGNTWDWCQSRQGLHFAIKGGGYMDSSRFCRIDAGYRNSPIDRDCCVGFRVQYETIL